MLGIIIYYKADINANKFIFLTILIYLTATEVATQIGTVKTQKNSNAALGNIHLMLKK